MADVTVDLGIRLGTCVTIRATIVRSSSNMKAADGRFFLRITHVENRQLQSPLECAFGVHQFATDRVKLPSSDFGLHKLVTGKAAKSLTSEQIAQLEKGYVGNSVTLIVYETGGFRGMPNELPKDAPPVAGLWIPLRDADHCAGSTLADRSSPYGTKEATGPFRQYFHRN